MIELSISVPEHAPGYATGFGDGEITDEELSVLALAGDPEAPIPPDAVPYAPITGQSALPAWYMPAAMIRSSARWHRPLIYAVIAAFLIVDAFGLCSTYG